METLRLLCQIHELNFDTSGSKGNEEIQVLLDEYGWVSDSNPPPWFLKMLRAISDRHPTTFDFYHVDDAIESDASSILIELEERFSWELEDEGEWTTIRFPGSQLEVFISREGIDAEGKGCNTCTVTLTSGETN